MEESSELHVAAFKYKMLSQTYIASKSFLSERFTTYFRVIFLCLFRSRDLNSVWCFDEEPFRPGNRFVLCCRTEIELDLWEGSRWYFPKSMLTWCYSDMFSLPFFRGPVTSSFQSATSCSAQRTPCLHSTTDSIVGWKFYTFWWIWMNSCSRGYVTDLARISVCTLSKQQESSLMNRHCINGSACVKMEKLTAAEFWELLRDQ